MLYSVFMIPTLHHGSMFEFYEKKGRFNQLQRCIITFSTCEQCFCLLSFIDINHFMILPKYDYFSNRTGMQTPSESD